MKTLIILPTLFFISIGLIWAQPDITGRWIATGEQGDGIVEVYIGKDGKYHGRFIKALDKDQDRQIREQMRETGKNEIIVLQDMVYNNDNTWSKGSIFSVSRQMKFSCKIRFEDASHLEVTGYYGLSFLSKTFTWRRP